MLQQIAAVIGGLFAFVHIAWTTLMLVFTPMIVDATDPRRSVGLPFGPKPYSTSPLVVFVVLSVATSIVRLLAEIVHRRGWGHGVATIFVGWLGVSSIRSMISIYEVPTSSDILQLAVNMFIGAMLLMWIIMARREKITL